MGRPLFGPARRSRVLLGPHSLLPCVAVLVIRLLRVDRGEVP